jgi:hypothetical protein
MQTLQNAIEFVDFKGHGFGRRLVQPAVLGAPSLLRLCFCGKGGRPHLLKPARFNWRGFSHVSEEVRVDEVRISRALRPGYLFGRQLARLNSCQFKTAVQMTVLLFLAVMVPPTLAQPAAQASPRPTSAASSGLYRISGTVVDSASGEPIRHATVAVLSEEDSHTIAAVESGSDGHFSLDRLPAAKYQLTASKRGFRTAFYDEHKNYNSAVVTGPGQETANLTFRLVPGAVLHGAVTTDGGDPVEGARVMLFLKFHDGKPAARILQSDSTTTDDTGTYEFSNLAAGDYMLAVIAEPWYAMHHSPGRENLLNPNTADSSGQPDPAGALDVAYPVTFYDSTTDEASAARITLAGGSRVEADIALHAVPALHIQVDAPLKQDGSIARAELSQTVLGTVIGTQSAGFLDALKTGTTEFNGVAPGHYELLQGDPPRVLDLDATSNIQVDPTLGTPTVSVRGTLRTPPGTPIPDACSLTLEPVDGSPHQSPIQSICLRGAFTFPSLPAGQWQLSADGAGGQWSVVSVTIRGRTHPGNLISVQDHSISIVVDISQGATRLQGFAHRDGKGVPGVMVVLVPKELAAMDGLSRRDQSDSDGSFSLCDVVPGQYTVVAIEDGWELDWAEPQVIARYLPGGIPVTVSDNSGKLVTLSTPVPVQSR